MLLQHGLSLPPARPLSLSLSLPPSLSPSLPLPLSPAVAETDEQVRHGQAVRVCDAELHSPNLVQQQFESVVMPSIAQKVSIIEDD